MLFEEKQAVGVAFDRDKEKRSVRAKREVILSAGTIGSVQLLLLSGVGPRDHLREMRVSCSSLLSVWFLVSNATASVTLKVPGKRA